MIPSGGLSAVPVHLTNWKIRARPQGWGLKFCTHSLDWEHASYRSPSTELRACEPLSADTSNKTHSFRLVNYMYWYVLLHVLLHVQCIIHMVLKKYNIVSLSLSIIPSVSTLPLLFNLSHLVRKLICIFPFPFLHCIH